MKPTIGRIVHFFINDTIYPAIVTKVWSDTCVNLTVFGFLTSAAIDFTSVMLEDENNKDRTWNWPPKV